MRKTLPVFLSGLIGGAVGGAMMFFLLKISGVSPGPANQVQESPTESRTDSVAEQVRPRPASAVQRERAGSEAQPSTPGSPSLLNASAAENSAPGQAAPRIDLSRLPSYAALVDDTVVPAPSEVFAVLDKADMRAWSRLMQPKGGRTAVSGSKEHIALLLGLTIADGFIATEAEDAEALQEIGRGVLELSNALGVGKVAKARSNAIIEAANHKDWRSVRRELDKAQHEVQAAMAELNSAAVAQLVSLGGWLRGTDALVSVIAQDPSGNSIELLHQPLLVQHFLTRLANLPKSMQTGEVASLQRALREIQPLMEKEAGLTAADVQALQQITAPLVAGIRNGTL